MKKLQRCGLCKRPMIYYSALDGVSVQTQGPKTRKDIKVWCYGRCLGIPAEMDILLAVLLDANPQRKKWAEKLVRDIEDSFNQLVKGLARGRSS